MDGLCSRCWCPAQDGKKYCTGCEVIIYHIRSDITLCLERSYIASGKYSDLQNHVREYLDVAGKPSGEEDINHAIAEQAVYLSDNSRQEWIREAEKFPLLFLSKFEQSPELFFSISSARIQRWETEREKEEEQKAKWRSQHRCQHCGGKFKGFWTLKCQDCGLTKDYIS